GLVVKKLTADARVTPTESSLTNLTLQLPRSEVKNQFEFQYANFPAFYDFISSVYMRANLKNSYIALSDLSCFSPELKKMLDPMKVTGKFNGTVDNLKVKELYLQAANQTVVKGKGVIQGLPSLDEMFFDMQYDEAVSSASDLKIIYPDIVLPKEIARAGTISLKGNVTGFLNDFVGNILVNTDQGMVQTDLNMKLNNGIPKYSGSVTTSNFDVGKIFNLQGTIGKASFTTTISGSGIMLVDVNTSLVSHIDKFEVLGYAYKNISVNGILDSKVFTGKLLVKDENIYLDFQGKVDLQDSIPVYDFYAEVANAHLDKLGFTSRPLTISSNLNINLIGQNPLTGTGTVTATKTIFSDETDSYKVNNLLFDVKQKNQTQKHLTLRADFISADLDGEFNLTELPDAIVDAIKKYLPSLNADFGDSPAPQNFDFSIKLNEMKDFNNFFLKGIEGLSNATVNGHFANDSSNINFDGVIPFVKYGSVFSKDLVLIGESNLGTLNLTVTSNFLQLNDSLKILDPFVSAALVNNSVLFNIKANDQSGNYKIDLLATAQGENDILKIKFLPSSLLLNQQLWNFNPSNEITWGTNSLSFKNLNLSHNNQTITIENAEVNDTGSVKLSFNNVQIEDFYNLFRLNNYEVKGRVTGYASIMNLFDKPRYDANLTAFQFGLNGDSADKVIAVVNYDPVKDEMNIDAKVKDDLYDLEAKGIYDPDKKEDALDFKIEIVKCELGIVGKYLGDYLTDVNGKIAGQIFLKGSTAKPKLTGSLVIPSATAQINYLKTTYSFSGEEIKLTENKIDLGEFTLYDDKGNPATVGGEIDHNYLSDFKLNIHLATKNFHMLNTNQFDNSLFYGSAYTGGTLFINGSVDALDLSATLTSKQGTEISIPVSDDASVSGNSFVRFVHHDSTLQIIQKKIESDNPNLKLNFNLTLNPLAKLNIIFDQKAGDIITGTGNGNIRLEIDLDGNFNMFGNYVIEKGDYNFTLQNFFNKKFAIDKGSTISWNGDPYQAQIDINAIYSISRVSFADLVSQNLDNLSASDQKDIE
ncbi:MAG: translocation/assembly module TamB domain-containing protein, partial [Bacteroidota bacterium]